MTELYKEEPKQPTNTKPITAAWAKEEYEAMQERAHSMGYHLMAKWRKNLKSTRVGVITKGSDLRLDDPESETKV